MTQFGRALHELNIDRHPLRQRAPGQGAG
jgi:hypothetical protein